MGASQAWSPASTDHSLPQPGPPARGMGVMPAASLFPDLDGSTLQRQPRQWAKGRVGETGGSPQANGALGGRGPVCLDLTPRLHLVLLWPRLLSHLPRGAWLTAQLGCVLLSCFQLDLDLRTCRVPQLASVWMGCPRGPWGAAPTRGADTVLQPCAIDEGVPLVGRA